MRRTLEKQKVKQIIGLIDKMTYMQIACKVDTTYDTVKYYIYKYKAGAIDKNGNEKPCKICSKDIEVGGSMSVSDMTEDNFGLSVGDNVTICRTGHDDNDDSPKVVKGVIEGIYKYFFLIQAKLGYKTSLLKAELIDRSKTLERA